MEKVIHDLKERLSDAETKNRWLQAELEELRNKAQGAELEAQRLAFADPLTGLPNLRLAERYLETEFSKAQQGQVTLAVVSLDIDQLHSINFSLGNRVGDALLRSLGQRLSYRLAPQETLVRGHEDEFLVLVSLPVGGAEGQQAAAQTALALARRLLEYLEEPVAADSHFLLVSGCCALVVSQGEDPATTLWRRLHLCQRMAKRKGRNQIQAYNDSLEQEARRRARLAEELQNAERNEEFFLHFQPIVDLQNSQFFGAEVLLRWNHPTRGLLYPGEFLDIAQRAGCMISIGEWVLQESLRVAAQLKTLCICLNLSSQELLQASFSRHFMKSLNQAKVARPDHLILDISQQDLSRDGELMADTLRTLTQWHIQLAVDDFTGEQFSLRSIKDLNIRHIKLDARLVQDPANDALIGATAQLAHVLNCQVWAEQVETREQLQRMKDLGVRYVQGNYICPPLPAGTLKDRLLHPLREV